MISALNIVYICKNIFLHMTERKQQLSAIRVKLEAIEKAEKRLVIVEHLIADLLNDLAVRASRMDEEYRDVEKLEKMSTAHLFHKILGDIGTRITKEKQEYLDAVLDYDDVANKIRVLEYEKELLVKKVVTKPEVMGYFEKYLEEKKIEIIADPGHTFRNALLNLDRKTQNLISQKKLITEADVSAKKLIEYLFSVHESLSKLDPWTDFTITRDYISYQRKKFFAGSRQVISMIDYLMQELDQDLKAINEGLSAKVDYRPFTSFVASIHQEVISGWGSNTHLTRAIKCIDQNIANIRDLINSLKYLGEKADREIEVLENEKKLYIEKAD